MTDPPADRPLRVALLTPCFWPEVRRGTERFVRELADGLISRGHLPTLITSHPGLPSRSVEEGLPVLRLPRPPHRLLERRNFESYLSHVPLSYLALRAGNFDIAHAAFPTDALAAARWGARTRRPSLLSYMGIPNDYWLDAARLRRRILRRAVSGCDAVVVLSVHAERAFERSLGARAETIAPGVDLEAFRPLAPRSQQPTIVCAAAVEVTRKNVALLIAAFGRVRERWPKARLILSRPADAAAARRAGIDLETAGIEWEDLDDRRALARAYSEAWVAVLPSVEEAFGLVLIEALACGTPVVGYGDAAVPEVIDRPEIGRVFAALDPDALASAILDTLALSADEATARSCRARAEDFSIGACTDRYLALYAELLERRAG